MKEKNIEKPNCLNQENYLNLFEQIPEDEHNHISNKIWGALDRVGVELGQDAELSIRVYYNNS